MEIMTEYTDEVERQRQKNEAEIWGKKVKYILASNGVIETAFNNGDIQYVENKSKGKTTWHRESQESLMDKFYRWQADHR
jgi:hypothetical protein